MIGSRALRESRVERRQPLLSPGGFEGVRGRDARDGRIETTSSDTQCGFKFFRRAAADDVFGRQRIDGYMFDVEILHLATEGRLSDRPGARSVARRRRQPAAARARQPAEPRGSAADSLRPELRAGGRRLENATGRGRGGCASSSPAAPASSAATWSIGSSASHVVTVYDNFSTGRESFPRAGARPLRTPRWCAATCSIADGPDAGDDSGAAPSVVFHLAANADVRFGTEHPRRDLEQNTFATFNVLEAMRATGVRRIAFSSTGSIYGEPDVFPTPERAPFPVQTSLYGASKLAGEGLIQAYCEGFGFQGYIFRFVSILGERYSHGHVFDFYRSLLARIRSELHVLGDDTSASPALYVQDCIDAILTAMRVAPRTK